MVVLTLIAAFVLSAFALPAPLALWAPVWPVLVMSFWVIALPHRVTPLTGWTSGLVLDVLFAAPLGLHASAYLVVAFVGNRIHARFAQYSLWQQSFVMAAFAALTLLARLLGHWLNGAVVDAWIVPTGALTTGLMWPTVAWILRAAQSLFDIQ